MTPRLRPHGAGPWPRAASAAAALACAAFIAAVPRAAGAVPVQVFSAAEAVFSGAGPINDAQRAFQTAAFATAPPSASLLGVAYTGEVPDTLRDPNFLPGDHYNAAAGSASLALQRGLTFSTPGAGLLVDNPLRPYFGLDEFSSFPGPVLVPLGSTRLRLDFDIPGAPGQAGGVSAFSAFFAGAEITGSAFIRAFSAAGDLLVEAPVEAHPEAAERVFRGLGSGQSFLGFVLGEGLLAARIEMELGHNAILDADEGELAFTDNRPGTFGEDVVALGAMQFMPPLSLQGPPPDGDPGDPPPPHQVPEPRGLVLLALGVVAWLRHAPPRRRNTLARLFLMLGLGGGGLAQAQTVFEAQNVNGFGNATFNSQVKAFETLLVTQHGGLLQLEMPSIPGGVTDGFLAPDAFNQPGTGSGFFRNSGIVMTTPGTGLLLDSAVGQLPSFGFDEFRSAAGVMLPIGSTHIDLRFDVPGQPGRPAGVSGFGIRLASVQRTGAATLRAFAADGTLLLERHAPVITGSVEAVRRGRPGGLSFLGFTLEDGRLAARIELEIGTVAIIDPGFGQLQLGPPRPGFSQIDIVAIDSIVFGPGVPLD